MARPQTAGLTYAEADEALKDQVVEQWKDYFPSVGKYIVLEGGFTTVAMMGQEAIGLVSVKWRKLPPPLSPAMEGYIYDIEVLEAYRRRGIATQLVEEAMMKAAAEGACQLRAWSSEDKAEAIPMWKALGFALCPTTHAMWGPEITGYFVAKRVPIGPREQAERRFRRGL